MLETIRESRSFKAPLPPRAAKPAAAAKAEACKDYDRYHGDQDPTDDNEGLEYAKAYHSMQLKALKTGQSATAKAEGSPNSSTSDQSFVCNMSVASEPLYGDPGEEDFWK